MIPLGLSLLMLLPSATLDSRSERAIDLFVDVCLKGEARFARGDVEPAGSLPWPIYNRIGTGKGQFYRVRRPVEAWIAVTDGGNEARRYERACRVSAKYIDVRDAANRIRAYLRESPLPAGLPLVYYEEYYLEGAAKFAVSQADYQVVMENYSLTGEAGERARRKFPPRQGELQ